jgi:Uma2 family endonuclease
MVQEYKLSRPLPTEEDLPETDHTLVDNELQILIPTLLREILVLLWGDRSDWFMGMNLGVYYDPELPAIGPDAFLSLGVQRFRSQGKLRLSYLVWQENNVVPQWVLEIVSKTPGDEYTEKMSKYARMGVLYYAVYNPEYFQRTQHELLEVYRLENGIYLRQPGHCVWMPEIGLGIGAEQGTFQGLEREWLYWYDQKGNRYSTPEELATQTEERAVQAERRAEALAQRLRELGLEP